LSNILQKQIKEFRSEQESLYENAGGGKRSERAESVSIRVKITKKENVSKIPQAVRRREGNMRRSLKQGGLKQGGEKVQGKGRVVL